MFIVINSRVAHSSSLSWDFNMGPEGKIALLCFKNNKAIRVNKYVVWVRKKKNLDDEFQ